jgi:predicted metal-dependent HD superfamily phosphohydrolase
MKLGEEGIEVVMLAAWFHDTGYTEKYRGHEEISVRIATEFLRGQQYPEEKIRLLTGCIRATKIPQQPHNLLEEIVADADLSGLGRKSFFAKSELLHHEWEKAFETRYSDEEWARQNLDLLREHRYFTPYASGKYNDTQAENIRRLSKKIRKLNLSAQELAIARTGDNDEYTEIF